jgi:hypothetical protein
MSMRDRKPHSRKRGRCSYLSGQRSSRARKGRPQNRHGCSELNLCEPKVRVVVRHKSFAALQVSVSAAPSSEPARLSPWCEVDHCLFDWAPRSLKRESEKVIMVEVLIGEMVGSDGVPPERLTREPWSAMRSSEPRRNSALIRAEGNSLLKNKDRDGPSSFREYYARCGLLLQDQRELLHAQSRIRDIQQISDRFVRFQYATAGLSTSALDGYGLRDPLLARPTP